MTLETLWSLVQPLAKVGRQHSALCIILLSACAESVHSRPLRGDLYCCPSSQVDILTTDLEGHDHKVLLATNFSALRPMPRYILYENEHIPAEKRAVVMQWLGEHGYHFVSHVGGCGREEMDVLVGRGGS